MKKRDDLPGFLELMKKHGLSYNANMGYVSAGWFPILERLFPKLKGLGWDGKVDQIKEKFGKLRIYVANGSEPIYSAIAEAETESGKACEDCGAPGRSDSWAGKENSGWIRTLCEQHGKERRG
jgi:hypothetical protein